MSNWTHAICADHWDERVPGSPADRARIQAIDPCCWCREGTNIYVRERPEAVPCRGQHPWEEGER